MILGIMGAMPNEVDQLCAKLENVTVEPYGGVEYHKGTLAGKQVVVCCAGMGKANAAATTQVLITKFGAEKIIFSGIAGNMTSKIGTKAAIEAKCAPDCVEMEGAAVSQIAAKNGVPCVILRAMSDNADEDGHEVLVVKKFSIGEYVATATKIVAAMVESL